MLKFIVMKKDYHAFTMTRIENVVTFEQEKNLKLTAVSVLYTWASLFMLQ